MSTNCQNCKWWQKFPLFDAERPDEVKEFAGHFKQAGWCKRFPPVWFVNASKVGGYEQRCPETTCDDFCGEFCCRSNGPIATSSIG